MGLPDNTSVTSLLLAICLLGLASTQDTQNYYYSSANTHNRFVPSPSFQSQRQTSSASYPSGSRGASSSVYPQPGSYQEQLLFIANDGQQHQQQQPVSQSQTSAAYSPFGSQYSQTRNPDYYDISPRPFGVAGTTGVGNAAASNSLTRSKAIRPSAAASSGFITQQQPIRSNVPHQQAQFLTHFNDPDVANDKPSSTSSRFSAAGFGTTATRPFGSSGFVPSSNRNRATPANSPYVAEDPQPQPPQQQLPFRNTRNRFYPSSASSTTSTEVTTAVSSSKRFNRFGASRTQQQPSSAGFRSQQTRTTTTTAAAPHGFSPKRPTYGRKANKPTSAPTSNAGTSFQPRRPGFVSSSEINEPVQTAKQRPFTLSSGRVRLPPTTPTKEKLLKQQVAATATAVKQAISAESGSNEYNEDAEDDDDNDDDEGEYYEEVNENSGNHVGNGPKKSAEVSLEKLGLHEASATMTSTATEVTPALVEETTHSKKTEKDHTVLFNTQQPAEDKLEANNESKEQSAEGSQHYAAASGEEQTTLRTAEYEYEYVEEDETTEATTNVKPVESTTEASTEETTKLPASAEVSGQQEEQTTSIDSTQSIKVQNEKENVQLTATTFPPNIKVISKEQPKHEEQHILQEQLTQHHANDEHSQQEEESSTEYDDEEYDEEEEDGENAGGEEEDEESEGSSEGSGAHTAPISKAVVTTYHPEGPVKVTHKQMNDNFDREVISVVTTKSVVNGSTAFPAPVTPRTTATTLSVEEDQNILMENKVRPTLSRDDPPADTENADDLKMENDNEQNLNNATESYVVIASIQTSRSINGARFLPFPAINQEETKQTLSELERKIHGSKSTKTDKSKKDETSEQSNESVETTTVPESTSTVENTTTATAIVAVSSSTESIIDKLDRVQSELSSGLLSGKYPIISQMDVSTPATSTTSGSSKFAPNIRKFQHKTTPSPKVRVHHLDEVEMDELAGLLPVGFKPRHSFKNRKLTTTSTTTEAPVPKIMFHKPSRNSTISRSYKNGAAAQNVGLAGLLPKGYKQPTTTTPEAAATSDITDIFSKIKFDDNLEKLLPNDYKATTVKPAVTIIDDISRFLPPGFKLNNTSTVKPILLVQDDISKFLPPGYKPPAEETDTIAKSGGIVPLKTDELSKLLPPDFKLHGDLNKPMVAAPEAIDIAQLLPKGYKPGVAKPAEPTDVKKKVEQSNSANAQHPASTTAKTPINAGDANPAGNSSSNFKVVFPKGIHKRIGSHRLTTPRTNGNAEDGVNNSPPVVIKKGPPMRATTEFTGWPTPSTTPISIEKLLEQAKTATIDFEDLLGPTSSSTTTTSTTTTTTTTTPRPTKPGHCTSECDLAATIKIIDGVAWKPELLDHNTLEWKNLAREVEAQLNEVYSKAPQLNKWYQKVRIDSFSKGSVLVDYYVELANITEDVNTLEIRKLFHQALTPPKLPMLPSKPEIENETDSDNDESFNDKLKEEKLVKETFIMGKYLIDPIATDFTVIAKTLSPTIEFAEEDNLLPQWAIVVIVIGVGSLLFVVIFGVTVLLNRQKRSKKTPIPLTNDMLNELKINHMGGTDNYGVDDFYNIDDTWNDTKQPIKPKRFTNSVHDSNGSNIYDSWRSTRHGDYYYDSQHNYSQKGDSLQRSSHPGHHQQQQQQQQHHHSQSHHGNHQYAQHSPYQPQYPDAFSDAHQMYTYNNHASRSRYPRDYDPEF